MVQRVVVNTLVRDEERAVALQQTGVNGQGGPSISTVANVEMPSIPGAPVAGVHVSVSITFASKQKPIFPAEAAISAGLAETRLTPSVAAPAPEGQASGNQGPASSLERTLLNQEAKRHIEEITSLQSNWEFARLFDLARQVSTRADEYGNRLSSEIRRQLYEQLARVEVVRARQQARPDEVPDFGRARDLLRKAKHESD
jgi:hypothetical protein